MRRIVEVDFHKPLVEHAYRLLREKEAVLLDSNTLILLAHGSGPMWVRRLLFEWEKYGLKAICGICDFIARESVNVEKWKLNGTAVRGFLSEAAESGAYVELKTPVRSVDAGSRDMFVNVLPKAQRNRLVRNHRLSGTDKCLILVAWHLRGNGVNVSIVTEDDAMKQACEELMIKTR